MININEFAFCFFSPDEKIVINQEEEVDKLLSKYTIEKWYRHKRSIKYMSFSQMVNDAIDDTDSEFMIFCNPKTKFTYEDIESILYKLSNGFCFASIVNFGFFGFSKELIRRIGMMDESFIRGEYEDHDFGIRLLHFGKAVSFYYNKNKYQQKISKSDTFRHIGSSVLDMKYEFIDNTIYIKNRLFQHKEISKRHKELKQYIFDSWLPMNNNEGDSFLTEYFGKNIVLMDDAYIEKNVEFKVILIRNNTHFKIELLCQDKIKLHYFFIKSVEEGGNYMWRGEVKNNMFNTFSVFSDKDLEIRLFLAGNQIYNTVLNPIDDFNLKFKIPTMVKEKNIN